MTLRTSPLCQKYALAGVPGYVRVPTKEDVARIRLCARAQYHSGPDLVCGGELPPISTGHLGLAEGGLGISPGTCLCPRLNTPRDCDRCGPAAAGPGPGLAGHPPLPDKPDPVSSPVEGSITGCVRVVATASPPIGQTGSCIGSLLGHLRSGSRATVSAHLARHTGTASATPSWPGSAPPESRPPSIRIPWTAAIPKVSAERITS